MKGGQTPIHLQRWAPMDYHEDEHVRLLKARHDYRTLTFYRHFMDRSFTSGGDLPSDPEGLAAVVEMSVKDVKVALSYCVGRLIFEEGGRLFQPRVRRDVAEELLFREEQAERGRLSGQARKRNGRSTTVQPHLNERSLNPPAPAPAPPPAPAPVARVVPPNGVASAPERALPVNGLTDPALTEYANGIWDEFVRRSGKADRVMSPLEWQHVTRWWGKGIALSTVLQALSEVKNRGDTLGYYAQAVETEHGRVGRALQR